MEAKAHRADHLKLYERVSLDLGQGENSLLPVNARLDQFGEAPAKDPALVSLVYNFGRYLLIASSRQTCRGFGTRMSGRPGGRNTPATSTPK